MQRKELLYTYIYSVVVKVIAFTRIIDQLVLQIASESNRQMDRQKYPKSRKPIRITQPKTLGNTGKQPQTLENKQFPSLPEMGGGTSIKHRRT